MLFAQRPLIENLTREEAEDTKAFTILPLQKSQFHLADVERFHVQKRLRRLNSFQGHLLSSQI